MFGGAILKLTLYTSVACKLREVCLLQMYSLVYLLLIIGPPGGFECYLLLNGDENN